MTDPFRIRAIVPNFEAIQADSRAMNAAALRDLRHGGEVAYGAHADARLDLYLPENPQNAPVHLFIHGGYWRANRKEDHAFVARTVVDAGAIAVIVEYPLMPAARMDDLVAHVRAAADWVAAHIGEYGGDPTTISASGHSAGGHLASYLAARGPHESALVVRAKALLLVSGIYDLAPITGSFLQDEISLTEDEVAQWSPLGAVAGDVPVSLAVGGKESSPFLDQSQALQQVLPRADRLVVDGEDHMSIVQSMGVAGSAMARLLVQTIERSKA